ncbi:MAG TPA: winged helix-turn-helix domain-containing protein [Terriglobia bacterium]|nr:winged helix-turn-helix domain-containing protein [Terriglobia bacterium]
MSTLNNSPATARFGDFELNRRTGELYRKGLKVKLKGQPVQLLMLLLDRPGEVVTREEMRARLWPEDTFVDFEHSLNSAIKKLRAALRDSAAQPRFIETLTRQGYRFIAAVETASPPPSPHLPVAASPAVSPAAAEAHGKDAPPPRAKTLFPLNRTLAALAFLLVAVLLIGVSRWPFARRAGYSDMTLLLSGQGDLLDPAISPDGVMLAYVKVERASRKIQVRRVTGGQPVTLFDDSAREAEPAFSPDGERMAFTRYPVPPGRSQICIGPALGGEIVEVIDGGRDPAWSPDGKRLAFIFERPGTPQELATVAIDGTDVRPVLDADSTYPFLHFPTWSADGRTLAVERSMGGVTGEIWLIPSRGGASKRLRAIRPGIFLHHPVFTPDGNGLIYSSNRSGATNLWYRSLKDNRSTQITRGPGPEEWPGVSRSGRVVFLDYESKDRLYLSSLDHAAPKELLSHSPFLWMPSISPDGREVAVSRGEYNGAWHIWSVPTAGGEPRALTSGRDPQIYGHFSHDGQWLVYFTWIPGAGRVWRVPRSGGTAEPLTPANEVASYGDLSPDGSKLAYTKTEKRVDHVVIAPIGGGPEHQLTQFPSTVARWSPDGQWITFSPDRRYADGVFIARPNGSGVKRVTSTGGWPLWLPDGKRIAFCTLGEDGNQRLNFVQLQDGKVSTLKGFEFGGDNMPVDFSPDGKVMAYTDTVTFSSEIWLLETHE